MPESQKQDLTPPTRVAAILAAGKGTRMRSSLPKVLHPVAGRPMLQWVIDSARAAGCERILIIVGHAADEVRAAVEGDDIHFVEQTEQLGTGHALAQVEPHVDDASLLLVLSGDVPLVTPATLDSLLNAAQAGWGAMAVAELEEPGSLGRVLARHGADDRHGTLDRIVEASDASPDELRCRLINAGLYALPAPAIFDFLRRLDNDNAKGEYYLTDALGDAANNGRALHLVTLEDASEAFGINTRKDQARVHRRLIERCHEALLDSGVTLLEPARTSIEPGVRIGPDTVIHPQVSLSGNTEIGQGCVIHQGAIIRDSKIADGVIIEAYSLVDRADIASECTVGPFARLRPASVLLKGARVGNFVEIKKTRLGEHSKASHLTYLGDAIIGANSNIGAGVVTCNYDGVAKHQTDIGDAVFIGSDTMLVAPVQVGDGATTAAGSVITQSVPAGSLAVGRARQRNIDDWAERKRRSKSPESDKDTGTG